ncbi:hypothetical protein A3197_21035 [Candidatus Thiodiazotropha endoloripes]|nr:hypothetical protein [Candidatus Thiodiazotropha lotti]MCW4211922.1 hypothetical protein [Candidatus Thiodiazotropha lotti]ODC02146.1 hypothetical protein A3197_21035 [Candidatus Thiodiazotropha endoloripes]
MEYRSQPQLTNPAHHVVFDTQTVQVSFLDRFITVDANKHDLFRLDGWLTISNPLQYGIMHTQQAGNRHAVRIA